MVIEMTLILQRKITTMSENNENTISNLSSINDLIGDDDHLSGNDYEERDENDMHCEFYDNGNVKYEGEWKDGLPNGFGKLIKKGIVIYEGEWNNGVFKINNSTSIEIENGNIFLNETRMSGLFGCTKRMNRDVLDIALLSSWEDYSNLTMSIMVLIIGEGCGKDINEDLCICNYPHLRKLIMKKNSLKNLSYFVISNNEYLESIEIEDGDVELTDDLGSDDNSGVCSYVMSLTLSSIF